MDPITVVEIVDLSDKGSDSENMNDSHQVVPLRKQQCLDCGTAKTPLWRSGPAGPKSLCNACGIRNRKKRRALLGLPNTDTRQEKKKLIRVDSNGSNYSSRNSQHSESSTATGGDRLMAFWEKLQPQNVSVEELDEEQQAALLLMAMASLGSKSNFC